MPAQLPIATTQKSQFLDITPVVQEYISEAKIVDGLAVVFVPHTTAGITINEHADPDVRADILTHLEKIVPEKGTYRHAEGNSPAHIKASLMGSSVTVIISGGRLQLGTWQGIYFCEFDGPRHRNIWIRILAK
ncbi:MAG: secondary thiamine-phosphate synthase enzyme YjbQ [candidate division Zixibacteria bacterium]|nr:secondary thiamine-phosphate synthase enzyme YjbQ [candidate division Zixibacteria bacterium]